MGVFRITYTDPETEEENVVEVTIEATETVSAYEWAEDYAYTLADKGRYDIKEIKNTKEAV